MASVGQFNRVMQYVREAKEMVRTGAIWFGDGEAAIYFMWGQPSHAFVRHDGEIIEGDMALKSIALSLKTKGSVTWRSKELLQKETLRTSSDDLLQVLAQLKDASAGVPDLDATTSSAGRCGTAGEIPAYTLNQFPLLPAGTAVWSDVPVSLVHLDVLVSSLHPLLVVLEGEGSRAVGIVSERELFDALFVDQERSFTGREAWEAMFNCTMGTVSAYEIDDRVAQAIPTLWRGRILYRDMDKRWLAAEKFLQFAGASPGDRAVLVATTTRVGVVLYLGGEPVVSYTSIAKRPSHDLAEILDLFRDPNNGAVTLLERRLQDSADPFPVLIRDEAPQPEISTRTVNAEVARQ